MFVIIALLNYCLNKWQPQRLIMSQSCWVWELQCGSISPSCILPLLTHLISSDLISYYLSFDIIWYHHIQFDIIQSHLIFSHFIWWFFLCNLISSDPIRFQPISSSLILFDITCSHQNHTISSNYNWSHLTLYDLIQSPLVSSDLIFS